MLEINSERLKSAFALVNLENEFQREVEHTARFLPAVMEKKNISISGENLPIMFMESSAVGKN